MKRYVIAWLCLLLPLLSHSQGENNIWLVNLWSTLNFNIDPPAFLELPAEGGSPPAYKYNHAGAVCDAEGNLRFWVKLYGQYNKVFNASGNGICDLNFDETIYGESGNFDPIIVPHPGNPDQYYIFYTYSGGILYTLIDMSMNGGDGGVVPEQHDKTLCGFNTIVADRITSIIGCDGIWIVARSSLAKEFYSWHITAKGLDTTRVVSVCGTLDLYWMADTQLDGILKGSPSGNKLALTGHKGVEIYDFEKCSGKVKNARIIDHALDTPMLLSPGDTAISSTFYGVCFSQDETRLYITENFKRRTSNIYAAGNTVGVVYQYNVYLSSTTDISGSKTLILQNPYTIIPDVIYGCVLEMINPLGEIKQGPDGKLYLTNNAPPTCLEDPPPIYNNYPGYHVINQPNELGLACNPQLNAVYVSEGSTIGFNLPSDILIAPSPPDTLFGIVNKIVSCFKDTVELTGSSDALCHQWDNGSKERNRKVFRNGRYLFQYLNAVCEYRTDTFDVEIVRPPLITDIKAACPQMKNGITSLVNGYLDTTTLRYEFLDKDGNILYSSISKTGCSFNGLDTGINYVRISTASGCDTIYPIYVPALSMPRASFTCDTLVCAGMPIQFTNTSDTEKGTWFFDWNITISERNPIYIFPHAGEYDIWLVAENEVGCTDTAHGKVRVEALELLLHASPEIADRGEQVQLVSAANKDYAVLGWLPEIFTNLSAKSQMIKADSSQWFTVIAHSDKLGCIDSASVRIEVEPTVLMPDAFSPNGDGINDIFRPVTVKDVIIDVFSVFDRWGKQVYEATGKSQVVGWDGTDKGKPSNSGTYHYLLQYVSLKGSPVVLKGTITLVR